MEAKAVAFCFDRRCSESDVHERAPLHGRRAVSDATQYRGQHSIQHALSRG